MKHPAPLVTAIEEAKRHAFAAYEINDKILTKTSQHCVGGALFQHALDIADATTILIEKGLPGPALALARPLVESCVRGLWASKCADDGEIGEFLGTERRGPRRLNELSASVMQQIPTEAEWLEETTARQEVRSMFNDLTHGGRRQVRYRLGEEAIEPKVPVAMQIALLELGNEIRQKSLSQLRELMDRGS